MKKWKDVTGYRRGETHVIPRSWDLSLGRVRVTISRMNGANPDQWFGYCHDLGIEGLELGEPGLAAEEAQLLMLKELQTFLSQTLEEVQKEIWK